MMCLKMRRQDNLKPCTLPSLQNNNHNTHKPHLSHSKLRKIQSPSHRVITIATSSRQKKTTKQAIGRLTETSTRTTTNSSSSKRPSLSITTKKYKRKVCWAISKPSTPEINSQIKSPPSTAKESPKTSRKTSNKNRTNAVSQKKEWLLSRTAE